MSKNNRYIFFMLFFATHTAFSADHLDDSFFESYDIFSLPSSPQSSMPSQTFSDEESQFFELGTPSPIDFSLTDTPNDSYTLVDPEPEVIAFAHTPIRTKTKRTRDQMTPDIHTSLPKLDRRLALKVSCEPFRARFINLPATYNDEDLYPCPYCTTNIAQQASNLERHIKSKHANEASIDCPQCLRTFYTQQAGILHSCTLAPQIPALTETYRKTYQSDQSLPHARKIDSLYHCPYCETGTSLHLSLLNNHIQTTHYAATTTASCPHCGIKIYTQEYLDKHLQRHVHKKKSNTPVRQRVPKKRSEAPARQCTPKNTSDTPDNAESSAYLIKTIPELHAIIATLPHALQKGEYYKCHLCNKKTDTLGYLNHHQHSHKSLKGVICIFCKRRLYTQDHAYAHQCKCPEESCCYSEKTLDALSKHTQERHPALALELGLHNLNLEIFIQESIALSELSHTEDDAALTQQSSTCGETGEIEFDTAIYSTEKN